ncbi:MAG: hypothetical protein ACOY5R_17795 [Pseudomonadota bacterium]|jgi:hypothetical protein|uniref:hypothetical protein n=1 Tax=Rhizorhabdus phycosphaerae TaxID=2711156 RepID=UPI0013ECF388|nr:hypothetical protein [Rhizorhabdus phycosphaerae]
MRKDNRQDEMRDLDGQQPRKIWSAPAIEDADISALTQGRGTSGVEGSSFLKPGS